MDKEEIKVKLLAETAKIGWQELEKFFARGVLLKVSKEHDLVEVAAQMACDESDAVASLMQTNGLVEVGVDQAKIWSKQNAALWTVVVSPWVIVQQRT